MDKRSREDLDDEPRETTPAERGYGDFQPAEIPVSPDGGIAPGFAGVGTPAPAPSFDESICTKGPCRHYWRLTTMFDAGNPAETWEALGVSEPRQRHHVCLVNPGMETNLGDDLVYECNRWDPLEEHELIQLERRRESYDRRAGEDAAAVAVATAIEADNTGADPMDALDQFEDVEDDVVTPTRED